LYPIFKALFVEPNPVPVKAALAEAGILASSEVRLPLSEMSADSAKTLFGALAAFRR
jgi:4-hydroxy-tetrahydrodipicolinate synthase